MFSEAGSRHRPAARSEALGSLPLPPRQMKVHAVAPYADDEHERAAQNEEAKEEEEKVDEEEELREGAETDGKEEDGRSQP